MDYHRGRDLLDAMNVKRFFTFLSGIYFGWRMVGVGPFSESRGAGRWRHVKPVNDQSNEGVVACQGNRLQQLLAA